MFYSGEENNGWDSIVDSPDVVIEESTELQFLKVEDFTLEKFGEIGMISAGSAIIISLLVLGIISILRTR